MVFNLDAMWRLNNRLQLITENVLIPTGTEVVRREFSDEGLFEDTFLTERQPDRSDFGQ